MNSTDSKPRVALFGLGLMGSGMAKRLLGAGFPLTIYNRSAAKAAELVAGGACLASTPREAAARADIIVSMVADDVASRALWLGEDGALAGAAAGTIAVECSTLTPAWIEELAKAVAAKKCELLDAPVTGSKVHAASGELCFLVGGTSAALEKARPVLTVMSRAIVHLGPTGSGALIKLINNFLCGVQAASVAEAIAIVERSTLDKAKAIEILTNGTPGSPLVKTVVPRMLAHDYTTNFVLALMAKDLTYSVKEGERRGVPLTTVAAALEVFKKAIAAGHGDKDFSSVVEPLRNAK